MTNVWYVGSDDVRIIKPSDWQLAGVSGGIVTWGPANGYSVDESIFSEDQLEILRAEPDFLFGQVGNRYLPDLPPELNVNNPNYAYWVAVKNMYDSLQSDSPDFQDGLRLAIIGSVAKAVPVDADRLAIIDSVGSALKTLSISSLKTMIFNYIVGASPGTLDTLVEIATSLGNNPDLAGTLTGLINAKYTKPGGGIPSTDFTTAVQTSLGKADNAIPTDVDLVAIAALVSAANKIPYATGPGTWALADFSVAARALLDDADVAAQRVTLGVLPDPVSNVPTWTKYGDELARPTEPAIVFFGNSLSANSLSSSPWNGTSASRKSSFRIDGFATCAMIAARQIGTWHHAGVSGDTSTLGLARFDTDVAPLKPKVVVVEFLYNDANNGIASATTIANLYAIWKKCWAIGADVIAVTGPPGSGLSTAKSTAMAEVLLWMRNFARANPQKFALADMHAAMVNPLTGTTKAGITADNVHPNMAGGWVAGQPLVVPLQRFLKGNSSPLPVTNLLDVPNMIDNGLFTGTGGSFTPSTGLSGSFANNWSWSTPAGTTDGTNTSVGSKITRPDGFGDWQQINTTVMPASGYVTAIRDARSEWAVGDIVQACLEFEIDPGWVPAGLNLFDIFLSCRDSGTPFLHTGSATGSAVGQGPLTLMPSGVLLTPPISIPAGTTLLRAQIYISGLGIVRIGRCAVRKLPIAP